MAIIKTKEDSLVETKLQDDNLQTSAKSSRELPEKAEIKKRSFLATTIEELKKVEWSKPKYVLNWSLVIILFTAVFSISLGLIDNVFDAGLKFVDCTSVITQGENTDKNKVLGDCSKDFLQYATYQK